MYIYIYIYIYVNIEHKLERNNKHGGIFITDKNRYGNILASPCGICAKFGHGIDLRNTTTEQTRILLALHKNHNMQR